MCIAWAGAGESGKSMIVKHMKIIHQDGFSPDELMTYRMTLYRNLVDSAQAIISAIREIGVDCKTLSNRVRSLPTFLSHIHILTRLRRQTVPLSWITESRSLPGPLSAAVVRASV